MDGFAVIASDLESTPTRLEIIADVLQGLSLRYRSATPGSQVMTAPPSRMGQPRGPHRKYRFVPNRATNPLPGSVNILRPVQAGEFIRPRGQDLHKDTIVLKKAGACSRRISDSWHPWDLRFPCLRQASCGSLVTGDELVHPSEPLAPGKIRDANSYVLGNLIERSGGEVISLGVAPDDRRRSENAWRQPNLNRSI